MYSHEAAAQVYAEHARKAERANREAWKFQDAPMRPSERMRQMLRNPRPDSDR